MARAAELEIFSTPALFTVFTPQAWDDIRLKSAETMRAAMVGPRPQNVITPEMF